MIIFGWRSRTSIESTGTFDCPVCQQNQPHAITRSRPWFTLFFIPIFPTGGGSSSLVCGGCQSVLDPDRMYQHPERMDPEQIVMAKQVYSYPSQDPFSAPPIATTVASFNPHKPYVPTGTASLSIISLIFGLLSPVFFLACFASLLTSLIAIVTGHVALYSIKRSGGRLVGRGLAITGLAFGYLMMLFTVGAIAYIANLDTSNPTTSYYAENGSKTESSQDRLNSAEMMVTADSRGQIAFGNNEHAKAIAGNFANSMKTISEQAFTRTRKPVIQLSGGNFLTYCELQPNSCALIVHVPSYRKYEDDAKDVLAELAWSLAQNEASPYLNEGDKLAVALRGTFVYGDIMIGTFSTDDSDPTNYQLSKSQDLLDFFPVEATDNDLPATSSELSAASDFAHSSATSETDIKPIDTTKPTDDMPADLTPADLTPADAAPTEPERDSRSAPPTARSPEPAFENQIAVSLLATIKAPGWNIQSMAFINEDRHLAIGRLDSTLSIYDIANQQLLYQSQRLDQLGQVVSLAVSRDGQYLIAGGYSGATVVFSIEPSGALKFEKSLYKHDREASCLITSPRYDFVLSGGRGGTLAWQPYDERGENLRILQELDKQILAAYLPVDGSIAMATDGRSIIRFSLRDGKVVSQQELKKGAPQAASFHPDGKSLVVSYGNEVLEFEAESARQVQAYKRSELGVQWSVMLHPTRSWMLSGGRGITTVWDRKTGERLAVLDAEVGLYIQTMQATTDGKRFAMVPAAAGQSVQVFQFTELN